MGKSITVKWCTWISTPSDTPITDNLLYLDTTTIEPEPLHKFLCSTRNKDYNPKHFLKCYALLDYCKNAFVIRAPLDLTIRIDRNNTYASIEQYNQEFFDRCIEVRHKGTAEEDRITLTTLPAFIFYADESVIVESTPVPLVAPNNILPIPGRFDIGKWVRPVDYTGEVLDHNAPIVIKRGDPLFMVRFIPAKDATVVLERVERTDEITRLVRRCTLLKRAMSNVPLAKAYAMIAPLLKIFRKN